MTTYDLIRALGGLDRQFELTVTGHTIVGVDCTVNGNFAHYCRPGHLRTFNLANYAECPEYKRND
jgi:hypothetical protein